MTQSDSPAQASDDIGEYRATLEMDHETAVEHVRSAFTDAGFGIATEFAPSAMLNEKIDAGRDPYTVIGACHPVMADRALDASAKQMGALFPCNVVVWESDPGRQVVYHISIMKAAMQTGIAPDDEAMAAIATETGALVEEAWGALETAG
jgi:uncharacterized protein (DUF302 family)